MRISLPLTIGLFLAPIAAFASQDSVNLAVSNGTSPTALSLDIQTAGAACSNLSATAWSSSGGMLVCAEGMSGLTWSFLNKDQRDSALAGYPELPTALVAQSGQAGTSFSTANQTVTARFQSADATYAYYNAADTCNDYSSSNKEVCSCPIRLTRSSGAIAVMTNLKASNLETLCLFQHATKPTLTSSTTTLNKLVSAGRAW